MQTLRVVLLCADTEGALLHAQTQRVPCSVQEETGSDLSSITAAPAEEGEYGLEEAPAPST